jgi:predicted DNA-binding transcriptional regulator AlpA
MNQPSIIPDNAPSRVSPKQLAKYLGCSIQTIHRWSKDGTLPPPYRFGPKIVRWDVEVLRVMVKAAMNIVRAADQQQQTQSV